jgi:hypothetical protein
VPGRRLPPDWLPEELPPDDPERIRIRLDEGADAIAGYDLDEPPVPTPIANIGTAPSGAAADSGAA